MITKDFESQQNEVLNGLFAEFNVPASDLMFMKPYRNIILNPTQGNWALLTKGASYELLTKERWIDGGYGGGCSTSFAKNSVKIYENATGVLMMRGRAYGDWHFTELILLNKEENLTDQDVIHCMNDVLHKKHKVVNFK